MIELQDCIRLLAAVVRQWRHDAGDDPHELAELAAWLGITPAKLAALRPTPASARRAAGPVAPGHCQWCGVALRKPPRGRMPAYCGAACRGAARTWRLANGSE